MLSTLKLGRGHRRGEVREGHTVKAERTYVDFVIAGQSLQAYIGSEVGDRISPLGWTGNTACENRLINELSGLTKTELPTGRTVFYVCPECADIGCGAITALVVEMPNTIIWKDFGYETNYSEPELAKFRHVGPFEFEKRPYRKLLDQLRSKRFMA